MYDTSVMSNETVDYKSILVISNDIRVLAMFEAIRDLSIFLSKHYALQPNRAGIKP